MQPERAESQPNRKVIGRPFAPGNNANPGGRPAIISEIRDLARQYTPNAMNALVSIVDNHKAAPAARVAAAGIILDRAYGKAIQQVDASITVIDRMTPDERRSLIAAIDALRGAVTIDVMPDSVTEANDRG